MLTDDIPTDWSKISLRDACLLITDGSHFSPKPYPTGKAIVNVKDMREDTIDLESCTKISEKDFQILKRGGCAPQSCDILLSKDGTIGRVIVFPQNMEAGVLSSIAILRTYSDINPHFLSQVLRSFLLTKQIDLYASGSAIRRLVLRDIAKLVIPKPPLVEQQLLSHILNTLDTQIQQTELLIAKLKYIKTGLLQDLLTRGIDENGNVRNPTAHPEEFKEVFDGKLKIPFGWEVYPLAKVAELSSGVTLGRDLKGANTVELPYLRVANVQDGYLDLKEVKTIRVQKEEVNRFLLQPGDVLMTEGGDFDKLGRGTVWNGEIPQCLHQNHIFKVRTNRYYLYPEFLALISRSSYGKQFFLLSSKQSTNLASINSTQLKAFPVPCPDKEEQERIINVFNAQNMHIATEEANLNKLQQIKKGLMHDLLTGQVRVTHLMEEEEASSG